MNEKFTTKSKWFWHWEDDKEEAWLTEMAKQGLHLAKPLLFGKYMFQTGAPQEVVYRLDFVPANKKDESYFQLFQDAGWEHVCEMMGWQYWRKEIKPGETAEIFTDPESKILKYQRLLGFLAILALPILVNMFNMRLYMTRISALPDWLEGVLVVSACLVTVMFFLYIFIFIRLGLRIRQLKRM